MTNLSGYAGLLVFIIFGFQLYRLFFVIVGSTTVHIPFYIWELLETQSQKIPSANFMWPVTKKELTMSTGLLCAAFALVGIEVIEAMDQMEMVFYPTLLMFLFVIYLVEVLQYYKWRPYLSGEHKHQTPPITIREFKHIERCIREGKCPRCKKEVEPEWDVCFHCNKKLPWK